MESINIAEIINKIENQGIKVISIGNTHLNKVTRLEGDLETFIQTAKAFNENVVFMQDFSFSANDFFYKSDKPILGEYETLPNEEGIDLKQFVPLLADYESYIEQISSLFFRVFYKDQIFAYWHKAEWYESFTKLFEEAQQIFEEKEQTKKNEREQQQNEEREAAERRENYLLNLLEDLSTDDKFISLKTQKAKQEYALVRYPELSELSQHILKDEISNLNARIEARKILQ